MAASTTRATADRRATEGAAMQDMTAIHVLDGLFGVWAVSSASFLARGEIRADG